MELLSELIYILNRNRNYSLDTILPGSEERKLLNVISKGKTVTDEEAAQIVCGCAANDKAYLVLKRQLVKTLTEMVFHTNIAEGEYIDYQKFSFRGKKEMMIAEKLLSQNVYHNAEKIILKVKAYAEKFHMLGLQIDCVTHLRTVYTMKGYPKEVEFYNVVLKKLNKFLQYEHEAVGFIDLLESKTKYTIGKYRDIAMEAKYYSTQIREWQKESSSPALKLYLFKIDLIKCYHANELRECRFILDRITGIISNYSFLKTESLMLTLNLEWAKYVRSTGNIAGAAEYIHKALQQCNYEAFNKFEVQALNFDLKIKEKNYYAAGDILTEVKTHQLFSLLEAADQSAWLLREAYLYFIFSTINDTTASEKYTPAFFNAESPASFLTDACKALKGDKKGYNFMLAVIKEALLKPRHNDKAENPGNDLVIYYQTHMRDSCEERSKNFIKKFAKAAKSGFFNEGSKPESKAAEARAQAKNFDAPELIPYEHLFEMLASKALEIPIEK